MAKQRYCIVRGQVFRWEEKAPFVPSGKSVLGAMEYDTDKDQIRCHECGRFKTSLGAHLKEHGISARDYKLKHGLRQKTPLVSLSLQNKQKRIARSGNYSSMLAARNVPNVEAIQRANAAKRGPKHEDRNMRGACRAQLVSRLQSIASEMGRCPGVNDARSVYSSAYGHGLTANDLRELAGFERVPVGSHTIGGTKKYTKEILRELLVDFYVLNKRIPHVRDWSSGSLPSFSTYQTYFGLISNAYLAAGLINPGIRGAA